MPLHRSGLVDDHLLEELEFRETSPFFNRTECLEVNYAL